MISLSHGLGLTKIALVTTTLLRATAMIDTSADPLASYVWNSRVLVVTAPSEDDPQLVAQRRIFDEGRAGANERDLVFVEAIGDSPQASAVRRRFRLSAGFHVVLVGKDGNAKLASARAVSTDRLFALIDTMPMRRQEMQTRR